MFAIVGASGVAVNLAVFSLLTSVLGWHYLIAGALAIEVAMCSNYALNNNWTFTDRRRGRFGLASLARYHTVSLGGMLINLVVLHVLAGLFGFHMVLANLAGIALGTLWNFAANLGWTWRAPS
jgi:dolichol-phosphate mannosyltransferase